MGTIESLSFQRYQDTDRRVWASFVDRCDEAWVYHTPEFIEAAAYDCSFSVLVDGDLQGVCVLGRERRRLGAYLSGPGLALLPGAHQAWIYQGLLTKLHHLAVTARCECVEFILPPLAPANYRRNFAHCVLGQCGFGNGIRWRRASEPTSSSSRPSGASSGRRTSTRWARRWRSGASSTAATSSSGTWSSGPASPTRASGSREQDRRHRGRRLPRLPPL